MTEDPTGDALLEQHDIQWAAVAEPGDLTDKLVFTLKVASLGTVPPHSEWYVTFSGFFGPRLFVGMNTSDPTRGPAFTYGHMEYPPSGQGTIRAVAEGEADAGEFFPDGTIRITVSNSKVGGFAPGQTVYGVMAEVRAFDGPPLTGLTGVMDSVQRGDGYTVVGNASCNVVVVPVPAAPTGLTATAPNNSSPHKSEVTLGWSDNSDNEQVFRIERSISAASGFVEIATVGADTTAYTDKNVQGGNTYYYRVRASNAGGDSAYSNTASVFVK